MTRPADNSGKRLLKLKQAAVYLSLSTWTLRGIIQAGQLPIVVYAPNTPWLIDVKDLDTWIEKHKSAL
jgi:helix-turn-helix protein